MIDELLKYLQDGAQDYTNLKMLVPENDINEVLEMAVTLAQLGMKAEHVDRIVRFVEGTDSIRIANDLEKIAHRLHTLTDFE